MDRKSYIVNTHNGTNIASNIIDNKILWSYSPPFCMLGGVFNLND